MQTFHRTLTPYEEGMYHNPNGKVAGWFRTRLLQEVHRDALDHGDSQFQVYDSRGSLLVSGQLSVATGGSPQPATATLR
jgi:hypothetical protein